MLTVLIKSAHDEFGYEITDWHAHTSEGRVFVTLLGGEVRELTGGDIFVMSEGKTVARYDLRHAEAPHPGYRELSEAPVG